MNQDNKLSDLTNTITPSGNRDDISIENIALDYIEILKYYIDKCVTDRAIERAFLEGRDCATADDYRHVTLHAIVEAVELAKKPIEYGTIST